MQGHTYSGQGVAMVVLDKQEYTNKIQDILAQRDT